MKVTFLGTGDAFNAHGRCHPACLVTAPSTRFLLDCGPTTLLALKREGLASCDIDAVLLSHLHGDHIAGVPFLLLESIIETPRTRPLTVVGPVNTCRRIEDLFRDMYGEIAERERPFEFRCVEVRPGDEMRIGPLQLFAFGVPHQRSETALALRLTVDGKSILYSGDSGWTEDLVLHSQDTDLFICECTHFDTRVENHLDYRRLAENCRRFGCRRLILTHLGREVDPGRTGIDLELARDGLVLDL